MTNINKTILKPSTHIMMIFILGSFAFFIGHVSWPDSNPAILVGLILGIIEGKMKNLAFSESIDSFLSINTLIELDEQLIKTKWGKRYYIFRRFSFLFMVIVVIIINKGDLRVEIITGSLFLFFFSALVTLKSTFKLAELSRINPEQ